MTGQEPKAKSPEPIVTSRLIALRSLIEPYVAAERLVDPLLSWRGVWDILAAGMIVGAPLLVVGLAPANAQGRGAAWAFALPSLAFLLLFWPVQGLAREMDLVFAAFPAVYAGAWLCAQSAKRSWLALSILLVGHVVFWWVAGNPGWVNASRNLL